jgi:anti-sigma factor RsiW
MPMTEKTKPGATRTNFETSEVLQDERIAAMVSAYLDGELMGEELLLLEKLMHGNEELAREVAEMRRIDRQLTELGADILSEPVPDALLDALSRVNLG